MIKYTLSILFSCLLIMSPSCFADNQRSYTSNVGHKTLNGFADNQRSYISNVGHKTLNGFANMTTAVLEIPKNIINDTNDSNIVYGVIGGLFKGVLNTVGRTVVGVTDVITAPIPTKPIAYPVYVWDDFDADTSFGEVFRLQD